MAAGTAGGAAKTSPPTPLLWERGAARHRRHCPLRRRRGPAPPAQRGRRRGACHRRWPRALTRAPGAPVQRTPPRSRSGAAREQSADQFPGFGSTRPHQAPTSGCCSTCTAPITQPVPAGIIWYSSTCSAPARSVMATFWYMPSGPCRRSRYFTAPGRQTIG